MEYIFELREELWNGKLEKILTVLMTIVLLSAVVTMAYDRTDIREYGRVSKTTEATSSIVAISEIKAVSIMEDVLAKKTANLREEPVVEIAPAMVEVPVDKIENNVVEVPVEKIENTVAEVLVEETGNTVTEIPTEKIENIVAEVPTEEVENISADVLIEENTNPVTDIPMEEITNPVTEVPEERIAESAFLIDDTGMLYGFRPELADLSNGYLELPTEGCTGIRRGTFAGCTEWITEVHIPSNIVNIEDGAMTELCSLEYMVAETGHPTFITVDGVLYDIAGTTLLAYPAARVGAYFVPEQVQGVLENAFLNTSLSIIDVRGCGLSANCLLNISESCSIIE